MLGLISVILAGAAGFWLGLTTTLVAVLAGSSRVEVDTPLLAWLVDVTLTAGLTITSVWLGRRSRVSRYWISWRQLAAAIVGFMGFWALVIYAIASTAE